MSEPRPRYLKCRVVNVIDNPLGYKGIVVEDIDTEGRIYFGRTKPKDCTLNQGDVAYVYVKPVNMAFEEDERTMEVTLYDENNNKLDWTII